VPTTIGGWNGYPIEVSPVASVLWEQGFRFNSRGEMIFPPEKATKQTVAMTKQDVFPPYYSAKPPVTFGPEWCVSRAAEGVQPTYARFLNVLVPLLEQAGWEVEWQDRSPIATYRNAWARMRLHVAKTFVEAHFGSRSKPGMGHFHRRRRAASVEDIDDAFIAGLREVIAEATTRVDGMLGPAGEGTATKLAVPDAEQDKPAAKPKRKPRKSAKPKAGPIGTMPVDAPSDAPATPTGTASAVAVPPAPSLPPHTMMEASLMGSNVIEINRAPVLTLWATVVAEREGHDPQTALTLGKAVAGLNAQKKGRALGIYGPPKAERAPGKKAKKVGLGEDYWVQVCGRGVPVMDTEDGPRACVKDKPIDPASTLKYLTGKFGDALDDARAAMEELAAAFDPEELEDEAFELYEEFRPEIERGKRGWGQKGKLDLNLIRSLASQS